MKNGQELNITAPLIEEPGIAIWCCNRMWVTVFSPSHHWTANSFQEVSSEY